jgi:anti-anti-sigma factor
MILMLYTNLFGRRQRPRSNPQRISIPIEYRGADPMHVEVRKADDVIVVDLNGDLIAGATGDELLRAVMNELVAESWRKILLNLSEVGRIDSAGIGELVASIRMAEKLGTEVKLINLHGKVREILELGQILPLLDIYESEEAAMAAFTD